MEILVDIHSIVRWFVILVAVIAIVFYAMVWQRGTRAPGMERGLMAAFTGLIDLEVLLGIILIITQGLTGSRLAHGIIMIVAAAVAHSATRFRTRDAQANARIYVLTIIGALVLILLGITVVMSAMFG